MQIANCKLRIEDRQLKICNLQFAICSSLLSAPSAPLREIFCFLVLLTTVAASRAENWDRFRGPNGAGQSDARTIPSQWKPENTLWKQSLPGVGHSSPVIWDNTLFTMSADPQSGQQMVLAYDATSGQPLWERKFDVPSHHINDLNSLASSTPAVDGVHVYAMWLSGERVMLLAFTHAGDEVWRRDIGAFDEGHGFGKSPIVVDDLVIVANDSEGESAVVALDRLSGDVRWTVPRPSGITAYATPCLLDTSAAKKQLLTLSTASGLTAVDPQSGDVLWHGFRDELTQRCVASPIVAHGLVFVLCGQGGNGKLIIAARPGDESQPPQEVYRIQQSVPQVTTPIVADNLLFLWHDRGVASCYDAATGKQHWKERVGGDFHSSPIAIADRIFCASRTGDMIVLAASPKYQLLARNDLGEPCHATPAVAHDRLYIRTEKSLLCIGDPANNK
jgi:outer membrane protein assembly factor BamB